jgi:hypothetical protein
MKVKVKSIEKKQWNEKLNIRRTIIRILKTIGAFFLSVFCLLILPPFIMSIIFINEFIENNDILGLIIYAGMFVIIPSVFISITFYIVNKEDM